MISLHVQQHAPTLWSAWVFDPVIIPLIILGSYLYARGLSKSQGTRRKFHPRSKPIFFYSGVTIIFLALSSPLDHLAGELFVAHMAQHLLLVFAAPLILLGRPMIPVLRGIPRTIRRRLIAPVLTTSAIRILLRLLTRPLVSWCLYMVIIIGWHFPDPFDLAVQSEPVHIMEHATLSIGAIVFWWNIITPVPVRPNLSYLAKIPYIFLAVVPIFILGAFITYSPTPWYDAYATSTLVYGISRIEDQQIGGVLMWIPGSFILLTALIIALLQLVRNEEESQRDREQKGTQISQHNETT